MSERSQHSDDKIWGVQFPWQFPLGGTILYKQLPENLWSIKGFTKIKFAGLVDRALGGKQKDAKMMAECRSMKSVKKRWVVRGMR